MKRSFLRLEAGRVCLPVGLALVGHLVACDGDTPTGASSVSTTEGAGPAATLTATTTANTATSTATASTTTTAGGGTSACGLPSLASGGAAADDGGAAGAGGEAPAIDSERSATEACIAYGVARLSRQRECAGEPAGSLLADVFGLDSCPDALFAPGSTASIEGLASCAETWAAFPCKDVVRGLEPACAPRGTRASGEPCAFAAQCQSGACPHAHQQCGTCVARAGPGEPCDAAHVCDVGYLCDEVCIIPEADYTPMSVATDGPCLQHVDCMGDDLCVPGERGSVCTAPVPLGGGCALPSQYCGENAFCNQTFQCAPHPRLGEFCSVYAGSSEFGECAPGLACRMGEAPSTGVCVVSEPDEPCERGGQSCPEGALCNVDPECRYSCSEVALPREACSESTFCHPGTECRDGVCHPVESQGLFERWCAE